MEIPYDRTWESQFRSFSLQSQENERLHELIILIRLTDASEKLPNLLGSM